MFANLKNKIREETGSDLSQLAPKLSGVQQRVAAGFREMRNRGSTSSLSALEEESVGSPEEPNDSMKLAAASIKSRNNNIDWKQQADTLACEKTVLEEEKAQLVRRNLELSEAIKEVEAYKKKAIQYQDDLDQLEGFQTQEMAKIKHLLLEREQQLTESNATNTKLLAEISRLRGCQEELSNVQDELDAVRHSSEHQKQKLSLKVEQAESECKLLAEKLERAESLLAASTSDETLQGALAEAREATERRLEETRLELADVKAKWCSQVLSLETQLGRLSIQAGEEGTERRRAEKDLKEVQERLAQVTAERDEATNQLAQAESARREAIVAQELSSVEVQVLQQRINGLETEKNNLNKKYVVNNQLLEKLQSEKDFLAEKCVILETNQKDLEEEKRLKDRVNALEIESAELKTTVCSLQTSLVGKDMEYQSTKDNLEKLSAERDSLLLRNASLSQQGEFACRELQDEIDELKATLEQQKQESTQQFLELKKQLEQSNQSTIISELQEQLLDKNKNIKVLQQRLNDMKKTLQKELKCPSQVNDSSSTAHNSAAIEHSNSVDGSSPLLGTTPISDDINHTYLKHVLIKFLTSREYEAKHLTRAVATLLHFTPEEERLLRETLEWKMSWFGSKPNLGIGQTAKTIPPS